MKIFYTNPDGQQIVGELSGPSPVSLDAVGALATLLAVESVLSVDDAANAVGLTPQDLVNEAQGWAAASVV